MDIFGPEGKRLLPGSEAPSSGGGTAGSVSPAPADNADSKEPPDRADHIHHYPGALAGSPVPTPESGWPVRTF